MVVVPIALYMKLIQIFVLRDFSGDVLSVTCALMSVVAGLALFLEGLKLGVMPLGEAAGMVYAECACVLPPLPASI